MTRASSPTLYKRGGWVVLDTYVNWRPQENMTLRVGIQNILDTRYFQMLGASSSVPIAPSAAVAQQNPMELQLAPGRTLKASLTVDF